MARSLVSALLGAVVALWLLAATTNALAQQHGPVHNDRPTKSPEERCLNDCHQRHCDCFWRCNDTFEDLIERIACKKRCENDEGACRKSCTGGAT